MAQKESKLEEMNLTKRLAVCGAAPRRKAAELIKNGNVTVNGEIQTNPATLVTMRDKVCLNGKPVNKMPTHVYIMLNKPRGYVCTNNDPHAKKRALDLINLREDLRLFSCGRLDKDSEGLILFTNDGEFADRITHPGNGVFKTYALSVDHAFTSAELQKMCDGITHEGETLHAEDIYQTGPRKYLIVLMEGKNREIRRMAEYLGNEVNRLERVVIGNLKRGLLRPGQWRFMSKKDIALALNLEITDPEMRRFPDDLLRTQLKTGTPNAPFCKRKPRPPKKEA
ncbi:MAG: rRNA pseudouridine synthase [Lentisphaeria bacterium]|nr:rRNA pseudouridine synthase [Lentisphaeria bacterium]MBQ7404594.1 rRNA pseudouridine synthase [Lentisphaeria bacterium]